VVPVHASLSGETAKTDATPLESLTCRVETAGGRPAPDEFERWSAFVVGRHPPTRNRERRRRGSMILGRGGNKRKNVSGVAVRVIFVKLLLQESGVGADFRMN
jgi:hypothetical protein